MSRLPGGQSAWAARQTGTASQGFEGSEQNPERRVAAAAVAPGGREEEMIQFGLRGKKEEAQAPRLSAHPRAASARARSCSSACRAAASRLSGAGSPPASSSPSSMPTRRSSSAAGKPIMDIFKDHGEAYFRDGERKVIARLLRLRPAGAGDRRRRAVMAGRDAATTSAAPGISIWLKAELPLLLRRVLKRNNRPLLEKDPEGVMRQLMETRYPVYATADITVESRDLPHDDHRRRDHRGAGQEPAAGEAAPRTPSAWTADAMSAGRSPADPGRNDLRRARQPLLRRADRAGPDGARGGAHRGAARPGASAASSRTTTSPRATWRPSRRA